MWNYLCEKKVVRNKITCPKCQNELQLTYISENHIFHCTEKYYKIIKGRKQRRITCNFKISAYHGTWFEKVRMDLTKVCRFIAYFLIMPPPRQRFLMNELQINNNSVVDWTNFCREVINNIVVVIHIYAF